MKCGWLSWHVKMDPNIILQCFELFSLNRLNQGGMEIRRWDSRKCPELWLSKSCDVPTMGNHVSACPSWSRAWARVDHHRGKHWWRWAATLAWIAFGLGGLWLAPCLQAQAFAPPSANPFALLEGAWWQRAQSGENVSGYDRLAWELWCWKQSPQLEKRVGARPDQKSTIVQSLWCRGANVQRQVRNSGNL